MALCGLISYVALLPATLMVGLAGGTGLVEWAAGSLAPNQLLVMLLRGLLAVAAAVPVLLAGAAFAAAATMTAVRRALLGRPVTLLQLLSGGAAHWWPMLRLMLWSGATLCLGILGISALLLPLPPAAAAAGLIAGLYLVPAFGFYAPYLLRADGLGPRAAWRAALAGLRLRPAEHLWAGVVLTGTGALQTVLAAICAAIPLIGGTLAVSMRIFLATLQPLYMALRFERQVRPWLSEAGEL